MHRPDFSNKHMLISILGRVLSVIVFLWILFVFIPDVFNGIFNTFLGNAILIGIVLLVSLKNVVFALCLAILFFLLFRLAHTGVLGLQQYVTGKSGVVEGFSLFDMIVPKYTAKKPITPYSGMGKATHQLLTQAE